MGNYGGDDAVGDVGDNIGKVVDGGGGSFSSLVLATSSMKMSRESTWIPWALPRWSESMCLTTNLGDTKKDLGSEARRRLRLIWRFEWQHFHR